MEKLIKNEILKNFDKKIDELSKLYWYLCNYGYYFNNIHNLIDIVDDEITSMMYLREKIEIR